MPRVRRDSNTPIPFNDDRWRSIEQKLPSGLELDRRHAAFKKIKFQGTSCTQVRRTFFEHYPLFILAQLTLPTDDLNRSGIYRARWIDPWVEDVDNLTTHSYPAAKHCKAMGRANRAGFPVFYASERPSTAVFEVGSTSDTAMKSLFISRWDLVGSKGPVVSDITSAESFQEIS